METPERILETASELFIYYGMHSVTMDDIATHAGVSKKTIYLFYPDKNALVEAFIDKGIEDNIRLLDSEKFNNENTLTRLLITLNTLDGIFSKLNNKFVRDLRKYHHAAFNKLNEYKNVHLYYTLKINIECGVREELLRKGFDVDIIVKFYLASLTVILNRFVFPSSKYDASHVAKEISNHFINGMLTLKGQNEIAKCKDREKIVLLNRVVFE